MKVLYFSLLFFSFFLLGNASAFFEEESVSPTTVPSRNKYEAILALPKLLNEEPIAEELFRKDPNLTYVQQGQFAIAHKGVVKRYLEKFPYVVESPLRGLLVTDSLHDCIGVTGWDSSTNAAFLYHVPRSHVLTDNPASFELFLSELNGKITPSNAVINLATSYCTETLPKLISLLRKAGFPITGMDVDDSGLPRSYFMTNMVINPITGKVGVSRSYK